MYWPASGALARIESTIRCTTSTIYAALHLHGGAQLQASPHGHPVVVGSALALWHPHWQAAPAQDSHEHSVAFDMVLFSFRFG